MKVAKHVSPVPRKAAIVLYVPVPLSLIHIYKIFHTANENVVFIEKQRKNGGYHG